MSNSDIVVVGAGVAGITLSVELLKRKVPHTLIEAKNRIGGRIFSFSDNKTQSTIDNGQHLLSGSYKYFLELLKFLGTDKSLFIQKALYVPFWHKKGKIFRLRTLNGNSKFGFTTGILRFGLLPILAKVRLLRLLSRIDNFDPIQIRGLSLQEFLKKNNQDRYCFSYFWEPLALAIMNNSLENIPADLFLDTFRLGFFNDNNNSQLIFPTTGLSDLVTPYQSFAKNNEFVRLLLNTRVDKIEQKGKFFELYFRGGDKIISKTLFLCVPPNHLLKIIPNHWRNFEYFSFIDKVSFNPIVSSYLWLSEPILEEYFCAFPDSEIHWIFNRNKIEGISTNSFYLYSFTTSNAKKIFEMHESKIIEQILNELSIRLKNKQPKLIHYRVFKDKFATVNLNREFQKFQPVQQTPIQNLYIAGDWTKTGIPATIESAAKSAHLAFDYFWNKNYE